MFKTNQPKETMKKEIIKEEPLLEINIKVDRTINDKYDDRLNWSSFNMIDLMDIFETTLSDEGEYTFKHQDKAKRMTKRFRERLKAFIIENADKSELKNFDWSNWNDR